MKTLLCDSIDSLSPPSQIRAAVTSTRLSERNKLNIVLGEEIVVKQLQSVRTVLEDVLVLFYVKMLLSFVCLFVCLRKKEIRRAKTCTRQRNHQPIDTAAKRRTSRQTAADKWIKQQTNVLTAETVRYKILTYVCAGDIKSTTAAAAAAAAAVAAADAA
uniref:Uncharacterized protein n=1 Tax=Glossina austeni TaxID=7395 RepID=A0A1A9UTZ9_GLOAU